MIKVYGTEKKKMLNILILEILKKYSDIDHHLTQQEIMRKLKSEYGVESIDRRSVKANVQSLVDMGFPIDMESEDGYFIEEREFTDAELRILIDSVLFSKTLSENSAKALIEKLKGFGNVYFDAKVSHVKSTPHFTRTDNVSVMFSVGSINDAIDTKKKISFKYKRYDTDFKMHTQPMTYVMSPYQMVASNGQYYLLGNVDPHNNLSYYRIDKMSDVRILDEKIKPLTQIEGIDGKLDLPKFMAEHFYMLLGESVRATIKTDISMMDTLVDWFGKNFTILNRDDNTMVISIKCNERALLYWALQYGPYVEVLTPQSLRGKLKETVTDMYNKYNS